MKRSVFIFSFLPAAIFPLSALIIGLRNPSIFDAPVLLRDSPYFASLFFLTFGSAVFFSRTFRENRYGLFLFLSFTIGYFLLASILNKPEINTNNIYFAADSWSWYQRMGWEEGWNVRSRAVHPLVHLFFRPLVSLLSVLTGGNRFHANLIVLAFAGGGCVFLLWKILTDISRNQTHAVLFASLLGISASHLIFSSVIETYIFSAFCLLLFLWLIIGDKPPYLLVITSVVTLGITVTNVAQQILTGLIVQRNLKRLVLVFVLAAIVAIGLNVVARLIYPVTEYFFLPQNLSSEQKYGQEIDLKRAGLMLENLLIYNVAAPQPYAGMRNEMPRFNFLNGTIKEYAWFGWPALMLWMATLSLACYRFFRNLRANPSEQFLSMAMLACLAFNLLLHIGYGIEPFLYSADWTYALILFVAIALRDFSEHNWFNLAMLVVLMSLLVNNLWLIYLIAGQVNAFLG